MACRNLLDLSSFADDSSIFDLISSQDSSLYSSFYDDDSLGVSLDDALDPDSVKVRPAPVTHLPGNGNEHRH